MKSNSQKIVAIGHLEDQFLKFIGRDGLKPLFVVFGKSEVPTNNRVVPCVYPNQAMQKGVSVAGQPSYFG